MGKQAIRTANLCRTTLMATLLLSVVAACGRVEPSNPLTKQTGTPHSAVVTTSLTEGPPEQISIAKPLATEFPLQGTTLPAATRIPRQSVIGFHSDRVGDSYRVYISLPKGYDPQHPDGYPVIYLLDADWYFHGAVAERRIVGTTSFGIRAGCGSISQLGIRNGTGG